jgi:hypothetical protein
VETSPPRLTGPPRASPVRERRLSLDQMLNGAVLLLRYQIAGELIPCGVHSRSLCLSACAVGINAVYTPADGDPVGVRAIARRPDTIIGFGETRIHAETATFELRASEVANPRSGDQLSAGGETFVLQGEPEWRDPDRLVWSLDVRSA